MENTYGYPDLIDLTIQLNELKTALDKCMRQDNSFEKSKQIYLQMKEVECRLHAMEWHPFSLSTNYASI